jgi:outer membrane protein assembly factor BamB
MKVFALLLCLLCFFTVISDAQSVWQTNLDSKVQFYQTTDFGIVLTGTDSSLYAVDGQTGERLWRRQHKGLDETSITPVPDTDLILLTLDEGSKSRLEAIDLLSGASIWRSDKVKGDVLQLAVDPQNDLIACILVKDAKGKAGETLKRKPVTHVFRLSTGDELWKKDFDSDIEMMPSRFGENLGEIPFTLDNYRAPLFLDNRLFLFYEGSTSYESQTGKEKEREKFKINEDGLALTDADPVIDEKYVYISGQGKVRAVNRRTGNVEWKADDLGVTPELAIVGNVLFVRTGGQFTRIKNGEIVEKGAYGVSAINTQNGKTLWRYKGADKGLTNFVFKDANTILIADKDDLLTIDARNGKRINKFKHNIEKAQFVLVNERGEAVIGGQDEIAAFSIADLRMRKADFEKPNQLSLQSSQFNNINFALEPIQNPKSKIQNRELWRVKHKAPSRGIFRVMAGIALRAAALYFRYGGLATSAFNLTRSGLSIAKTINSFRWSGLQSRFDAVDLTSLASNSAKNYISGRIYAYGSISRNPSLLNRINGLQISIPTTSDIRNRVIGNAISRATPSRADVQESILDKLDPASQAEKLSSYLLRRKRMAELRGNYMYFYTDLPKPFDRKGLVGVNIHTGQDARFILASEPDARFTTDETINLLYSTDGSKLQAFDVLDHY